MQNVKFPDKGNQTSTGWRPHTPVHPTIEMTESRYLDALDKEIGIDKLVRPDSLFDYGAH
jgi:hypothetical protein